MNTRLRDRLAAGTPTVGGWLTTPSIKVADALASCGWDWVAVDLEHGSLGIEAAEAAAIAIERHGAAPLARLSHADPYQARRLLDGGFDGIIVPVVESADAFDAFARHCFYPPAGRRGVGLSRCNGYGDSFDTYLADFRPLLVAQIETRAGIDNTEAIAALATCDVLFVGPYDLSADLGDPGNFNSEPFRRAMTTLHAAAAKHHKAVGIHQVALDPAALTRQVADGYRFIAYGTDLIAMRSALGNPLQILEATPS